MKNRLVRPCCRAAARDFLRATGSIYLPHRPYCKYYRRRG